MTNITQPVPLFTFQAFKSFLVGPDKRRREEGKYDELSGDYERTALLALACFSLLAYQVQQWGQFDWGHVVDFNKLGNVMSTLPDYWEFVDLMSGVAKATFLTWPFFASLDLTILCNRKKAYEAFKEACILSCKSLSSLVNLLSRMVAVGALDGIDLNKWAVYGNASGALGFAASLHANLTNDPNESTEFKRVLLEVKAEAQETYAEQNSSKAFWDNVILASILAMNTIGFCGAVQTFGATNRLIKLVADHGEALFLGAFTAFCAGGIGSHLYEHQMRTFKQLNKAI